MLCLHCCRMLVDCPFCFRVLFLYIAGACAFSSLAAGSTAGSANNNSTEEFSREQRVFLRVCGLYMEEV